MPAKSAYAEPPIPDVDIWAFLFERNDKLYPDDKGMDLLKDVWALANNREQ
jgi:hypothetical protein